MTTVNGVQAVIFDCDGVMFDSREANAAYYNHQLARFNLPPMLEAELDFAHMHTNRESIEYLFLRRGEEGRRYLPQVLESLQGMDYSSFLTYMKIEPHLKEILEYLRPLYKTAISTNRTTTMPMILERFGLASWFDLVVTALDVEHPKPHPESLWKILGTFKLRPHEAIYIGDSLIDQMAAEEAHIPLIAYSNPMLKAAYHIQSLLELKAILS